MWQSKIEISRECNDIIGSAKGPQISENVYYTPLIKGKIEINAPIPWNRPLNHFICISNKKHLSLCSAKHRPLEMDSILHLTSSPCNFIGIEG
jgi:hypothetical protein